MRLLLDTHLLLWSAYAPGRLRPEATRLISDESNDVLFSAASIWEVAIKAAQGRDDFTADPHVLRRELLENGYDELAITGAHAVATSGLPDIHRDPFDRVLVAQARIEGITLLTSDRSVVAYGAPVRLV
ncbi:type II toxin-antitoxin system VapC family toxin [Microbacterium sp. YMB-B2]|uniref:Type II toxin-antitoxin system VapC family toxin n=1 Tax=Microbacterium tenebrionis TaxID=2830665 RepID=A0A9X1LQR8_9MICO|nr:type II toxin-antitoxin system VapC family toxin [Microbacterium tenebrionis]MCC2030204.1 type II toxin-antitoxin system VapC family toxin [Microbacterium tenebrionis]